MAWPDEPCEDCPRAAAGLPMPCRAMTTKHRRLCDLARTRPEYAAMLCDGVTPTPEPISEAEVARRRRAAKPRVPLGVQPKGG